mgnify:CR=1 FL=1
MPVEFIDLYCERTGPEFWAEPFNALSNAAFLVAAFWAWRVARARGGMDALEKALIALAAAIGVGSFLFHVFASAGTELADVIPIWSFVGLYVLTIIYRSTGQDPRRTIRIAGIAAVVTTGVIWFTSGDITTDPGAERDLFNGSLQYAPALIALLVFAGLTTLRGHPVRNYVVTAAAMFLLSLVFRSIDLQVCDVAIIGTHFLWHLLNALMVGVLLQALVVALPPRRGG